MSFRYFRGPGDCNLVEAIATVHDPGLFSLERHERACEWLQQRIVPDADDLTGSACGIGERSKQVEGRVNSELPTNITDPRGRAMIKRRKQEADSHLVQASFGY